MVKYKTFKIYTLGCKVNQCDSRELSGRLLAAGFVLGEKDVDLAVVNTCAVTKSAIRKGRRMVVKARKENPRARVVLFGCWPATYENEWEEMGVDLVWPTGNLAGLTKKINDVHTDVGTGVGTKVRTFEIKPPGEGERARYFLKIQDGCDQFCSYCNIPYARGGLMSRSVNGILKEARVAVRAGYREIVLCGIHLGRYGRNGRKILDSRFQDLNLEILLRKLIEIKNLGRVRLSSIEVGEIDDGLIELMKESDRICDHLHIPLQAGSDKILKLMNRPYDKEAFESQVLKIKKAIPGVAITTDVIVGFPGETKRDFEETCDFVKKINFSRLHVFPFSVHEKTLAYGMKNQLKIEIKRERAAKLRKLGDELEKKYEKSFLGKKERIVIEQMKEGMVLGTGEHYFKVRGKIKKIQKQKVGDIVEIVCGD